MASTSSQVELDEGSVPGAFLKEPLDAHNKAAL